MTIPTPTALLTDLYELTMAAAGFESGLQDVATFELFIRKLPERRSWLIAAGLEQAIDFLTAWRFTEFQLSPGCANSRSFSMCVRNSSIISAKCDSAARCGQCRSTIIFGQEPLLRVTAPILEAQLVETCLLTLLTFQTMIATKAARVVTAAQPLLARVVQGGRVKAGLPGLDQIRELARVELQRLPPRLLAGDPTESYPVTFSQQLQEEREELEHEIRKRRAGAG